MMIGVVVVKTPGFNMLVVGEKDKGAGRCNRFYAVPSTSTNVARERLISSIVRSCRVYVEEYTTTDGTVGYRIIG